MLTVEKYDVNERCLVLGKEYLTQQAKAGRDPRTISVDETAAAIAPTIDAELQRAIEAAEKVIDQVKEGTRLLVEELLRARMNYELHSLRQTWKGAGSIAAWTSRFYSQQQSWIAESLQLAVEPAALQGVTISPNAIAAQWVAESTASLAVLDDMNEAQAARMIASIEANWQYRPRQVAEKLFAGAKA